MVNTLSRLIPDLRSFSLPVALRLSEAEGSVAIFAEGPGRAFLDFELFISSANSLRSIESSISPAIQRPRHLSSQCSVFRESHSVRGGEFDGGFHVRGDRPMWLVISLEKISSRTVDVSEPQSR